MSKAITSILMIGTIGYTLYRYRYRLFNLVLGTGYLRRLFVQSIFSVPGVRNKMMNAVFQRPSNG